MTKTLSVTAARAQFLELAETLNRPPARDAVMVTKRGKPVLAMLPYELYESLVETLEVLSDAELMRSLRKSLREVRAGKSVARETVKKDLAL